MPIKKLRYRKIKDFSKMRNQHLKLTLLETGVIPSSPPPPKKKLKSMQRKEACEELLRVKIKRLQKESLCQRGRVEGN